MPATTTLRTEKYPATTGVAKLDKLIAAHAEAVAKYNEAGRARNEAHEDLKWSGRRDADATLVAVRAGKPAPPPKHANEARAAIEAATRLSSALGVLVGDAEGVVHAARREHAPDVQSHAATEAAAARSAIADAVEKLQLEFARLAHAEGLADWVAGGKSWRPRRPTIAHNGRGAGAISVDVSLGELVELATPKPREAFVASPPIEVDGERGVEATAGIMSW